MTCLVTFKNYEEQNFFLIFAQFSDNKAHQSVCLISWCLNPWGVVREHHERAFNVFCSLTKTLTKEFRMMVQKSIPATGRDEKQIQLDQTCNQTDGFSCERVKQGVLGVLAASSPISCLGAGSAGCGDPFLTVLTRHNGCWKVEIFISWSILLCLAAIFPWWCCFQQWCNACWEKNLLPCTAGLCLSLSEGGRGDGMGEIG